MRTLFLLFCLLLTTLATTAQSKGPFFPDRTGVVSYTFRESFKQDVPGTLDKIKALGITNIEFSNLFGKTAAELRALLDARGMVCTSYGTGYNEVLNKTEEVIGNAKALGAKYVRVAWIPHEGDFTLETAQKAAEDFNRAGKALRDNGLMFCYHNHGYEFQPYGDGTLFDYLVQHTDPAAVGFEMDILWVAHPGQDPVKLLKKYPQRFKLMHVKDLKKGVKGDLSGGTPVENDVALGTGQIDIAAVMKAARNTAIEYFYIEDESPSVDVQVPRSIAYLKGLAGKSK
jgi:sugar phosphate isomerase/epimerase